MDEITKELFECLKEAFTYGYHPGLPEGMHLHWLKVLERASMTPPAQQVAKADEFDNPYLLTGIELEPSNSACEDRMTQAPTHDGWGLFALSC